MELLCIFALIRIETMDDTYNPDWRYANMTQTEIEDHVKARSSLLLTRQHVIPESSGKKIKWLTRKSLCLGINFLKPEEKEDERNACSIQFGVYKKSV